jgi:hypothetical protein
MHGNETMSIIARRWLLSVLISWKGYLLPSETTYWKMESCGQCIKNELIRLN